MSLSHRRTHTPARDCCAPAAAPTGKDALRAAWLLLRALALLLKRLLSCRC